MQNKNNSKKKKMWEQSKEKNKNSLTFNQSKCQFPELHPVNPRKNMPSLTWKKQQHFK